MNALLLAILAFTLGSRRPDKDDRRRDEQPLHPGMAYGEYFDGKIQFLVMQLRLVANPYSSSYHIQQLALHSHSQSPSSALNMDIRPAAASMERPQQQTAAKSAPNRDVRL